jgi:hypothetical protein
LKKAGVVVGVTIILLAGILYWTAGNIKKGGAEGTKTPSAQISSSEALNGVTEKKITAIKATPKEPVKETAPVQPVVQPVIQPVIQKHVFTELDESDLGSPIITRTEVMVVSSKKIILIDSNFGEKTDKQLVYCVDLLYGDGVLSFYLNGSSYKSLTVGNKLKVDYEVYKNNNGVSFPVIVSVETI